MSYKKKVLFTGCSLTAGAGWYYHHNMDIVKTTPNKESEHLWVNICHKSIDQLKDLELLNKGVSGASNTEIFENTVANLSLYADQIDTIICQWTSGPRYNFNCGLEKWDTTEQLRTRDRRHNLNLSNGTSWSRDYIYGLLDKFLVLHHVHWEIVKIVKYSNIIKNLTAKYDNIKLYFINGLCPWDKDYFDKLQNVLPNDYTEFTKKNVIEIDHRSDEDIYFLYDKIHNDYKELGGINQQDWINLYNSFFENQTDYNFDGGHPGKNSNLRYANMIKTFFSNLYEQI